MTKERTYRNSHSLITAGSNYLDIDAYACMVAMAELLRMKGEEAIAYSCAPCNYSVCKSLIKDGQITSCLPDEYRAETTGYIIVDVSDPDFIKDGAPLDCVVEVYDHHVGFEDYWQAKIGDKTHIEFIGAAATLIYREWKKVGLEDKMSSESARLLIAAILDNTLYLTSSNTTHEDIEAFEALCKRENVGHEWCASYFSEVQSRVEADLKNAIFGDLKKIENNDVLPSVMAQLCVWDADRILTYLPSIREWFVSYDSWMINIIDIKHHCSYFVCDDIYCQEKMSKIFNFEFENGVAKTLNPYLRKEIIKKSRRLIW